MKKSALAVLLALNTAVPAVLANSISGVVLDPQGQPIANATVSLQGSVLTTQTDANGAFRLTAVPNKNVELHLVAKRYTHVNLQVQVPEQGVSDMRVVLQPSTFEVIDITASPLHASITESSLPVSVLAGEQLKMRQAATLGDTLRKEVGVHTNFHGGVASSPIIRGLDGPRVLITQNGLDAGDASRIGPDHSVATEASTAKQIEVLRGPATLFYGSGAIGGVINVVDERVPTNSTPRAEWLTELQSVDSAKLVAGSAVTGNSNYALYVDGFYRDSLDYKAPHGFKGEEHDEHEHADDAAHGEEEHKDVHRLANTASNSKGFTLGGSRLLSNGFVGLSYGRIEGEYGLPGHSHGDEEEEALSVKEQDRLQLQSELFFDDSWLRQVNSRFAYTDYQHVEIEEGEIGTIFKNRSHEARIELLHQPWQAWKGGLSLHYKYSDFAAIGEEAYTPPSESSTLAIGWMSERHFGPVLLQLGARAEQVKITADNVLLGAIELHGHSDEHAEEHDADHADEMATAFAFSKRYTPISLSAGVVWDFTEGYNMGLSFSRSERAPSAAELMSFGPHLGTRSYEVGALFQLNDDRDSFELNQAALELERSHNIDFTLRKLSGNVGWVLNAFYNRIDNYFYAQNTGLYAEFAHEEHGADEHAEELHDAHADELPVYLFANEDVALHGFEAQVFWQINPNYRLTVQGDYIRARLRAGGDLPRTPPLRLITELAYEGSLFDADVSVSRYFKQENTAQFEETSAGYTLLDASISYRFNLGSQAMVAYLKGQNLTDELALVHTSFLKDVTPLPGRNIAVGIRGTF